MTPATTINIQVPKGNDDSAIKSAKILFWGAVLSAVIAAFASLIGVGINAYVILYQKALEMGAFQDWKEKARQNDWIPRGECQWETVEGNGQDNNKKKVKIKINLLSSEYKWIYKSAAGAEIGGQEIDLGALIRGLDISANSKGIVAIGMASQEGGDIDQSFLSESRVDKLISLIKFELKPTIPVMGLSLGRFKNRVTNSNQNITSVQRRVVIAEILGQDDDVNLDEAIYNALVDAKKSSIKMTFDVEDYVDHKFTERGFRQL